MTRSFQGWRSRVLLMLTVVAAIALGSRAPALLRDWRGPVRHGDFRTHLAGQPARLPLYGTTTCPYCARARAYLTRTGVPFNDRVIDASPAAAALYGQLGENSVPLLVAADRMIIGFNQQEYAALVQAPMQKEKP